MGSLLAWKSEEGRPCLELLCCQPDHIEKVRNFDSGRIGVIGAIRVKLLEEQRGGERGSGAREVCGWVSESGSTNFIEKSYKRPDSWSVEVDAERQERREKSEFYN